jgi:hypothetical protein
MEAASPSTMKWMRQPHYVWFTHVLPGEHCSVSIYACEKVLAMKACSTSGALKSASGFMVLCTVVRWSEESRLPKLIGFAKQLALKMIVPRINQRTTRE